MEDDDGGVEEREGRGEEPVLVREGGESFCFYVAVRVICCRLLDSRARG
jgi:hypothetical protein